MTTHPLSTNPVTRAVTEFQRHRFAHPRAHDIFKLLGSEMGALSSPRIITLTGPTGVGKSTLIHALCNKILVSNESELQSRPDFVPVIALSAVPPSGTAFNWKDFYIRLLTGQNEPLVDRKLYLPKQSSLLPENQVISRGLEQSVSDALRRSVENHLKQRQTKLLIIDEAHHILLASKKQRLECQFESLKSLAAETGSTILLVGTYRLLDILDQSAQLTRRCQVVNFSRYDMRLCDDRQAFQQILNHLSAKLSEYVPTNLYKDAEYFYRKSAGCVGILKDWLTRCLEYALTESAQAIDAGFADRFALTNQGLMTIIEEAFWGEERLHDVDDSQLVDLLKNGIILQTSEMRIPKKNCRPGKRKPMRDPVGEMFV